MTVPSVVKAARASHANSVVGESPIRTDARTKVVGEARYIDDLSFSGACYATIVRSPHPHARIDGIDGAAALAMTGVLAVITWRDIPGKNKVPIVFDDEPLLAETEVRYVGEPVAIVVAEDARVSLEAARAVKVAYSELPAVTDPLEALKDGAQVVNPVLGNIVSRHRINKGDVEAGFREADVVVEGEFRTGYQEHAYIETNGMMAIPEDEGGIAVYGSMQCPFYIHKGLAYILGLPMSKLRVIQTVTGGGFGGKEDLPSMPACHVALAAFLTRRPVKHIMTREEDIVCTTKRHPGIIRIRYGAKRDGTLVACDVEYIINSGVWSTLSPVVLWRGTIHAAGPYRIPNVRVDAKAVATHTVPNGAFRGFGQPQVSFANESLIDELALKLGLDPIELRLRNALEIGSETATGHRLTESVGLRKVITQVRDNAHWTEARAKRERTLPDGRIYGIGASACFYGTGLGAAGKRIDRAGGFLQVDFDGSVQIAVGTTEMGQGHNMALAQITAEELGTFAERVTMLPIDTSRVPDSGPTVASRATLMSGGALRDAARKVRGLLHGVVARRHNVAPENITFTAGTIHAGKDATVSFDQAVAWAFEERIHLAAQGWFTAPQTEWSPETGLGEAYYVYTFSANVAEVAVDTGTGEVEVLRIVSGHDIGRAINRREAEGQIQGGVVQGLGYALFEDLVEKDGRILRPNFSGYIIPGTGDIPEITPIIVEEAYSEGPFGAKGLGEPPLIAVAPAIANAIADAVGVRPRRLPMIPERILALIEEKALGSAEEAA
jgi:CO/xanthine dehydrogenase Mo-binding subunit